MDCPLRNPGVDTCIRTTVFKLELNLPPLCPWAGHFRSLSFRLNKTWLTVVFKRSLLGTVKHMVKTSAVSTEGESWLHLPVGNGSEQTPSAGARGRTSGGAA